MEGLTIFPIEVKILANTLRSVAAELHPYCRVSHQHEGIDGTGQDLEKMNYLIEEITNVDELMKSMCNMMSGT